MVRKTQTDEYVGKFKEALTEKISENLREIQISWTTAKISKQTKNTDQEKHWAVDYPQYFLSLYI